MAKGGKRRTYVRDGNGRFASTPGSAAKKAAKSTSGRKGTLGARTGLKGSKAKLKAKDKADQTLQNTLSTRAQKGAVKRGSRKLAAAKVAAQTRIGGGRKGVIGKSRRLKGRGIAARSDAKPKPAPKIDMKQAINKATQLRNKAKQVSRQAESMMGGGRKDGAIVNMSLNSRARQSTVNRGITGSRLAAQAEALNNKAGRVLDRAIASRKKAEREALKPAKKQRSAESLRISRAKQVEKRRSIIITNPAGWREDAAAKMAANAARTQKRALDFYKQKGRAPKVPAPAPNPTRAKGSRTTLPRMPGTVAKPQGLKPGALAARGEVKPVASKLRPGKRITIKTKRTPKPTKQDKAFESVMNLKGVTDFSRGKQRQVWIDAKMMTLSRRKKLGLSGIRAESDRYYAREDINPTTRMPGYFMGTRSGWLNSQPKTRQGVIKRPRRSRRPRNS